MGNSFLSALLSLVLMTLALESELTVVSRLFSVRGAYQQLKMDATLRGKKIQRTLWQNINEVKQYPVDTDLHWTLWSKRSK